MYIDDEELRGLYKTSSAEHVQAIESALMQLEKQPQNTAVIKDLLRSAHTLKGDSRMLGVEDVETLVHQIEECLMPIEKGQALMTDELSDRLYLGLDTIKQLAHTAVTGEPNDVNMFYVLASLMGDGSAATPAIQNLKLSIHSLTQKKAVRSFDPVPVLLDLPVAGWIDVVGEAALFDEPIVGTAHRSTAPQIVSEPVAPAASLLQASFLELAAELFPPDDSTLPELEQGAVFNDFTLIASTENATDSFDLNTGNENLTFSIADEFASIGILEDSVTIDRAYGNLLTTLGFDSLMDLEAEISFEPIEPDLFSSFDDHAHSLTVVILPDPKLRDFPQRRSPRNRRQLQLHSTSSCRQRSHQRSIIKSRRFASRPNN